MPIRNGDYLFNYKAPAAVPYLIEFDLFEKSSLESKEKINKEIKYLKDAKIFCKNNTSEKLKKIKKYENFLEYNKNTGNMMTSLLIFEPNMETYKNLKKILCGKDKKYKDMSFTNDEIFFSYYYRNEWTFIDIRFNSALFFRKYPFLEYIFILNYQIGKPFLNKSKKKFKNYPEFKLWVNYLTSMVKHYPKLKDFVKKVYD